MAPDDRYLRELFRRAIHLRLLAEDQRIRLQAISAHRLNLVAAETMLRHALHSTWQDAVYAGRHDVAATLEAASRALRIERERGRERHANP